MYFPFIVEADNHLAIVESKTTDLFAFGSKYKCYWLDNHSSIDLDWNDMKPVIQRKVDQEGNITRFILAERWLERRGMSDMSMALRASIDFSSYQFRPFIKFFNDAKKRVLIADETGLGKTIEAGIILVESLAAIGQESCIVIMCPKSVQLKWYHELKTKFGVRASISDFKDFKQDIVPDGIHIISQDASPTQDSLQIPTDCIDLLIIDEIHNYIGRTANQKRRGRALSLSRSSKGVVGLSATPIQIEANDLRLILELIAPGEHSEQVWLEQQQIQVAVNRVIKAQTEGNPAATRDVIVLENHWPTDIDFSPNELLSPLSREDWSNIELEIRSIGPIGRRMTRARARDPDVKGANGKSLYRERIVTNHIISKGIYSTLISDIDYFIQEKMYFNHRRQLASCPSAALNILEKFDQDDNQIFNLINRIDNTMPNTGPKQQELFRLLSELSTRDEVSKTVIFTKWHTTFFHLKEQIKFTTFSVNPTVEKKEQNGVIERFANHEGYAVLLVTDAMSEGIDLDMANTIINIDLPFNPAKLQQRIGRLDRYTQESPFIEIHNIILEGSIEESQLNILQDRLDVFEQVIGGYESIINSDDDDGDIMTDEEIIELRQNYDLLKLAESNIVMNIIDSSLDGIISEQQRKLHPIHSRHHLIIKSALENLGAEVRWNNDDGELLVKMSNNQRQMLLSSKNFIPWGDGRVRLAFENVDDDGYIKLLMRGRNSTMGPLNPFVIACENLLFNIAGFFEEPPENNPILLTGSNSERWIKISDNQRVKISASDVLSLISEGRLDNQIRWYISDSDIICVGAD